MIPDNENDRSVTGDASEVLRFISTKRLTFSIKTHEPFVLRENECEFGGVTFESEPVDPRF